MGEHLNKLDDLSSRQITIKGIRELLTTNHFETIADFIHFFNPFTKLNNLLLLSIQQNKIFIIEFNRQIDQLVDILALSPTNSDMEVRIEALKQQVRKITREQAQNEKKYEDSLDPIYSAFTDNIFEFLGKGNSLILKQIKKQTYPEFKSIEFWKNLFKMSLKMSFEKHNMFMLDKTPFILYIINTLLTDITASYTPVSLLFLSITSPLLDIYAIARILKQPEGGPRSSMSICYFGNNHIENMVVLLKHIGYELVFSNLGETRCQTYTTQLNLTSELDKYNSYVDKEHQVFGGKTKTKRKGKTKRKTKRTL